MSVVIVTYNAEAFVARCLDALRLQTVPPLEIIVVDNDSTDRTVHIVEERYLEARVLKNKTNRGFTGGCNDGVAVAQGTWIAFLAPDGRPEPGWLEGLLGAAAAAKSGDIVRSLVLDDGLPLERYELIETMNLCGRLVRVDGVKGDFAFAAAGAASLFEKAAYPIPLPEGYFLYHEDLHMSWYARLLGHDIILARTSRIAHMSQASTKKVWGLSHFHGEKNRLTNFLVFWEGRTRMRLLPLYSLDLLLHMPQGPSTYPRAVLWNLRHRKYVVKKRLEIQSRRVVRDAELIPLLSSRVSPRSGWASELYGRFVLAYCRAFGLYTRELRSSGQSPGEAGN